MHGPQISIKPDDFNVKVLKTSLWVRGEVHSGTAGALVAMGKLEEGIEGYRRLLLHCSTMRWVLVDVAHTFSHWYDGIDFRGTPHALVFA